MSISSTLDQLHYNVKQNRWLRYFAVFNRLALAAGFCRQVSLKLLVSDLPAHYRLIIDGSLFSSLTQTGYYYTFIGIAPVTAAILLLIPGTALPDALIYFPIILNIGILSFAVRFEGSQFTSPLMVLANLYLLCWNYDKLKCIFPGNKKKFK
jgi:hypothetical protein